MRTTHNPEVDMSKWYSCWAVALFSSVVLHSTVITAREEQKPQSALDFSESITVHSKIEPKTQTPIQLKLELGKQLCHSQLTLTWQLTNATGKPIQWSRITSSCGCIQGLPNQVDLPKDESIELTLKVTCPRQQEKLAKQIVFWNDRGEAQCEVDVVGTILAPVLFDTDVMTIEKEDIHEQTFSITPVQPDIDLKQLSVEAFAPEAVHSEIVVNENNCGSLRIKFDPSKSTPFGLTSSILFEFRKEGQRAGTVTLPLRFPNRTILDPSPVIFRRNGKDYTADLRVRSHHFSAALAKKETVTVETQGKSETWNPLAASLDIEPEAKTGPMRLLHIRVPASALDSNTFPKELRLRCGKWQASLTCRVE
jgi:hypothetical protein